MRRRQFETNSIGSALRLPTITPLLLACVLLFGTSSAFATSIPLEIQFTGVNLSYANNTISDATDPNGGTGDPNDADPLDSIQINKDGVPVHSVLTSDIFLDVSIPGVMNLKKNDTSTVVTTAGDAGYFHLLVGPNAENFLKLETQKMTITYLNITNSVELQFLFGAAIVENYTQNLPFGLEIGDPVSVSFSTKVDEGSIVPPVGEFVTDFTSWGTGEVVGTFVPEPSSCVLGAIGLAASCACRRRWW